MPLPRSTAPDTPHSHPAHHAPETWSEWTGHIRRAAATTPAERLRGQASRRPVARTPHHYGQIVPRPARRLGGRVDCGFLPGLVPWLFKLLPRTPPSFEPCRFFSPFHLSHAQASHPLPRGVTDLTIFTSSKGFLILLLFFSQLSTTHKWG